MEHKIIYYIYLATYYIDHALLEVLTFGRNRENIV
jgi:hypothetical protein